MVFEGSPWVGRKGNSIMTSTDDEEPTPPPAPRSVELMPGDRVHVWDGAVLHCSGVVEIVAEDLGVIWVREDGTNGIGARRLLDVGEYQVQTQGPRPDPHRQPSRPLQHIVPGPADRSDHQRA